MEYVIQDDPPANPSWQWNDLSDGYFRVYDNGWIEIFAEVDGRGATSCGELNAIYMDGRPAFGERGLLNRHRGERFELPGTGLSSFGINVFAYEYPFSANKIVLLDYERLRADPDAGDFQQQLNDAARHLGRLNLLFADGSVRIMGPAAIRVAAELWKP